MPYSPSWVNKLIEWIGKLPVPAWVAYSGLYVLGVAYIALSLWAESPGRLAGSYQVALLNGIWIAFPLASIDYLIRFSNKAIDRFRPEMECSDDELELIRYRMNTIPQSIAVVIPLITEVIAYADAIWGSSQIVGDVTTPLAVTLAPLFPGLGISLCSPVDLPDDPPADLRQTHGHTGEAC